MRTTAITVQGSSFERVSRPWTAGLFLLVAAVLTVLVGCSSGDVESVSSESIVTTTASPTSGQLLCDRSVERIVTNVMGEAFVISGDEEDRSHGACEFVDESDGGKVVSVSVHATENGDVLAALVDSAAAMKIESDIPNEVYLTSSAGVLGNRVLVRRGGTSVLVGIQGVADQDTERTQLLDLARAFSGLLADTPYDSDVTVASVDCGLVDLEALADAMDQPAGTVRIAQLPGQAGCSLELHDSLIGAAINVEPGEADPESLAGRGGTTTVGDEVVVLEPESVDGIGEGAVWLSAGDGAPTGELYVLIGDRLVRVVVSGGESEVQQKSWATVVAQVAGPALVE